jgi:hypothetical protein
MPLEALATLLLRRILNRLRFKSFYFQASRRLAPPEVPIALMPIIGQLRTAYEMQSFSTPNGAAL